MQTESPNADDNEDVKRPEDIPVALQKFEFINVNEPSREKQSKNRQLVRSHVTKGVGEQKRRKKEGTLRVKLVEFGNKAKGKRRAKSEDKVDNIVGDDEIDQNPGLVQAVKFLQASTWVTNSAKLSQKALCESNISALRTYKGKITPLFHQFIQHRVS